MVNGTLRRGVGPGADDSCGRGSGTQPEQAGRIAKKKKNGRNKREKSQEKGTKKQDGHGDDGADLYAEDGEGRGLR